MLTLWPKHFSCAASYCSWHSHCNRKTWPVRLFCQKNSSGLGGVGYQAARVVGVVVTYTFSGWKIYIYRPAQDLFWRSKSRSLLVYRYFPNVISWRRSGWNLVLPRYFLSAGAGDAAYLAASPSWNFGEGTRSARVSWDITLIESLVYARPGRFGMDYSVLAFTLNVLSWNTCTGYSVNTLSQMMLFALFLSSAYGHG